jgi:hypothetical protein
MFLILFYELKFTWLQERTTILFSNYEFSIIKVWYNKCLNYTDNNKGGLSSSDKEYSFHVFWAKIMLSGYKRKCADKWMGSFNCVHEITLGKLRHSCSFPFVRREYVHLQRVCLRKPSSIFLFPCLFPSVDPIPDLRFSWRLVLIVKSRSYNTCRTCWNSKNPTFRLNLLPVSSWSIYWSILIVYLFDRVHLSTTPCII